MSSTIEQLLAEVQGHVRGQRWQAAIDCILYGIEKWESVPGLRFTLGELYRASGDFQRAKLAYESALNLDPAFALAHMHLAIVLDGTGDTPAALNHAMRAMQLDPRYADAAINCTNLLLKLGKTEQSIAVGRGAVELAPNSPIAWLNLGNALMAKPETHREAEEIFARALRLAPNFAPAHNALGVALDGREDFDKAIEHYNRAAQLDPGFLPVWINLGRALSSVGLIDQSIDAVRSGLAIAPHAIPLWKTLLSTMSYTDWPEETILKEHQRYVEQIIGKAKPLAPLPSLSTVSANNGLIRIGYMSPDFRAHPIASFIEPLLASHDRKQFEIFCYTNGAASDVVTERLRSYPSNWRDISQISDEDAAKLIHADALDVLIDLAGNTRGGRVELFRLRLAKAQISYLGYPTTTGLPEMDFRLTDAIADPPGESESAYVEQLVRLPNCFCCFTPPQTAPEIRPLPSLSKGHVTFGSLHAMSKINDRVIELWCKVLAAVPESRLLMLRNTLTPATQRRLAHVFTRNGIDPKRVTFANTFSADGGHLASYNDIDISLDTFPFTGHTTACQSLFMGVPIVTFIGPSHRQRLVATVLTHAGRPEWIAHSPEEYVRIAADLAADLPGLAIQRENLRQTMLVSPLCNAEQFTREFEATVAGLIGKVSP